MLSRLGWPNWTPRLPLVSISGGGAVVISEMAYAARRRMDVNDNDLVDMLELAEAARMWALMKYEETWAIGLFGDYDPDHQSGCQVIKGSGKSPCCE